MHPCYVYGMSSFSTAVIGTEIMSVYGLFIDQCATQISKLTCAFIVKPVLCQD